MPVGSMGNVSVDRVRSFPHLKTNWGMGVILVLEHRHRSTNVSDHVRCPLCANAFLSAREFSLRMPEQMLGTRSPSMVISIQSGRELDEKHRSQVEASPSTRTDFLS